MAASLCDVVKQVSKYSMQWIESQGDHEAKSSRGARERGGKIAPTPLQFVIRILHYDEPMLEKTDTSCL